MCKSPNPLGYISFVIKIAYGATNPRPTDGTVEGLRPTETYIPEFSKSRISKMMGLGKGGLRLEDMAIFGICLFLGCRKHPQKVQPLERLQVEKKREKLRSIPVWGGEAFTPLKTNISPENQWLEDEISFWDGPFLGPLKRGLLFIFRGLSNA